MAKNHDDQYGNGVESINHSRKISRQRGKKFVVLGFVLTLGWCLGNIAWSASTINDASKITLGQGEPLESGNVVGGSAFCLLIKDDNDILSEWVAYHYHVFRMRRLIVAVDPNSKASPLEVLEPWGSAGGNFDLKFTLWNDEDYTPSYFHERDYANIPLSVGKEITLVDPEYKKKNADAINQPILKTQYHRNTTYVREHQEEVRKHLHGINNHRFRQKNFVSECFRQVREEQEEMEPKSWSLSTSKSRNAISWVVHIDTDEFLVPNPWIASYIQNQSDTSGMKKFKREDLSAMLPEKPTDGSLWSLFQHFFAHSPSGAACLMMPRILFGSKEDGGPSIATTSTHKNVNSDKVNTSWNHTRFETLRWKYHSDFESEARPKSMVNVAYLTNGDGIFKKKLANSIHRPLPVKLRSRKTGCSSEPLVIDSRNKFREPLAVYHYLGSLERYLSRKDARRDTGVYRRYNEKSNYAKGDENQPTPDGSSGERWWIGGWLDSFVETHGSKATYTVLGEQYATQTVTESKANH